MELGGKLGSTSDEMKKLQDKIESHKLFGFHLFAKPVSRGQVPHKKLIMLAKAKNYFINSNWGLE